MGMQLVLMTMASEKILLALQAGGISENMVDSILSTLEQLVPLAPKKEGPAPASVYYFVEDGSPRLEQRLRDLLLHEEDPSAVSFWRRRAAARKLYNSLVEELGVSLDEPDSEFLAYFERRAAELP